MITPLMLERSIVPRLPPSEGGWVRGGELGQACVFSPHKRQPKSRISAEEPDLLKAILKDFAAHKLYFVVTLSDVVV
jgi:hypothetical protein